MRVLVVEDEMILALHLEMLVVGFGYEVCAIARSSDEALAQAIALRPDIVLTDIRLARGSNGVDLARELHARTGMRCIFVSANLDEPTRKAVQPYEPIEFLGKPIVPVVLQRALTKAKALIDP
ncbi:MAG TPA: response regulator [Hyphomicrobiaceae bacterium]|jgi:DNA-binding NarL/FixJ family response regulator|nr:response regulator [Hyphomicrobiaceae bacterium]